MSVTPCRHPAGTGVWVFNINDKEEKRVKTRSSSRMVPIHPHLIQLGLLENVETLNAKGTKNVVELSRANPSIPSGIPS